MVLGLRLKSKQITSIHVEYTVEVLEIKPWPSSQSLKSIHSVVLQWKSGDGKLGLTNPVTPSLSEEKIKINEIFRCQVTLMKEISGRNNGGGSFHKNILQFNLHEHKKDKAFKGKLGTAVLDLSQHGIIEDSLRVGLPLTLKRTLRNVGEPVLYVNLRSFEKSGPESSSSENSSKEVSSVGDGKGSVLTLMSEEYAEEDEIAAFTDDDDVTSHSSPTKSYSFVENDVVLSLQRSPEGKSHGKNVSETILKEDSEESWAKQESLNVSEKALEGDSEEGQVKQESLFHDACFEQIDGSAQSSPVGLSLDRVSSKNDNLDFSKTHKVCSAVPLDLSGTQTLPLSLHHEEKVLETTYRSTNQTTFRNYEEENDAENDAVHVEEDQIHNSYSSGAILQKEESNGSLLCVTQRSVTFSVRSPPRIVWSKGNTNESQCLGNLNEIRILEDVSNGVRPVSDRGANDTMKNSSSFHSRFSDKKVHELECRVELLEGELREAAAMEIALYSVVAEHGSSMHKVHTPARRLSRLYLYASNSMSGKRRAGAARSVVSGLVVVVKACGNDVPRLTFWLSNLVVLRAAVSHVIGQSEKPKSSAHSMEDVGIETAGKGKNFPLKWETIPLLKENFTFNEEFNDWDDPQTFAAALEKVEAWIFARIVESVWWQTLTPYMQSSKEGVESKSFSRWKKIYERESSLGEKTHASCSFQIWKIAFQDAREMLCPVRAEGHECGCLPMLAKQIMEQCVARLDVAMFNALLRESDDETSTDPVVDPIINHMVLPFPPGKSSFGAGAQLKNAIGNWSRSLSDLFGIDEDSSPNKNDVDYERADASVSLKSFHLLNALSDILMLPKHMLLEKKVRKEVCPAFSSSVIRRILSGFFPDEFCPDQVPESVFETMNSEDQIMLNDDGKIRNLPCNASPVSYSPPYVSSVQKIIGDVQRTSLMKRSRSSVIRKCHASDDELEELDSPFSAVIFDESPISSVKAKTRINSFRCQLLHDVWKFDD